MSNKNITHEVFFHVPIGCVWNFGSSIWWTKITFSFPFPFPTPNPGSKHSRKDLWRKRKRQKKRREDNTMKKLNLFVRFPLQFPFTWEIPPQIHYPCISMMSLHQVVTTYFWWSCYKLAFKIQLSACNTYFCC